MTATFDLEAEKKLVLTIINDPAAWDYVVETVNEGMFGSDIAIGAFAAVRHLTAQCKAVTPITVQTQMVEKGVIKGSVIPTWMKGPTLTMKDLQSVAARIRDLWTRRELARVTRAVADSVEESDPKDVIARLNTMLDSVEGGATASSKSLLALSMEYLTEIEEQAKNPGTRIYFDTGFSGFDKATGGLMAGELAVFAARPGNGKSSWVMAVASNLAKRGIPVGLFWMEDDGKDAVRRYIAREFKVSAYSFRAKPFDALKAVTKNNDYADRLSFPLYIDDTHGLTIGDITARMRRMKREHGVKVFILDHAGEVRIDRSEGWGDRHDLAVGQVARRYRDAAKELHAVPILVSQMNRRFEHRDANELPKMSDLDGSGQVEQAARQIAFIQQFRDKDGMATGKGALHLVKSTGGVPGTLRLRWDGPSMTWHEDA